MTNSIRKTLLNEVFCERECIVLWKFVIFIFTYRVDSQPHIVREDYICCMTINIESEHTIFPMLLSCIWFYLRAHIGAILLIHLPYLNKKALLSPLEYSRYQVIEKWIWSKLREVFYSFNNGQRSITISLSCSLQYWLMACVQMMSQIRDFWMEHEGRSTEIGSQNKLFPISCFNFSGLIDLSLGWNIPTLIENEM